MRVTRWVLLIAISAVIASSVEGAKKTPPGQRVGVYRVWAAGDYSGGGLATVKHKKISIDVSVQSDDGTVGDFQALNLQVKGNHFSGSGTVLGKQASLTGRVDVPDGVGEEVQSARLTCNFTSEDGHRGRIVGYLDVDASSP